jgi:hypothetical protein
MLPDDTVFSVLGVHPGTSAAGPVDAAADDAAADGAADEGAEAGPLPELDAPQPASTKLVAASAAIPTTTRFTNAPL